MCHRPCRSRSLASEARTPARKSSNAAEIGNERALAVPELADRFVPGAGDRDQLPGREQLAHGHLVLCQRPGLVGTDHRGASERFDDGQSADERVPFDHPAHADRKRDRDDGRQGFGDDGNGERDAEDQHVEQRQAPPEAERNNQCHDHERRFPQRSAERVEVFLQRRTAGINGLDQPGDLAELRCHSSGDDDGLSAAVGHDRPRVSHVSPIGDGEFRLGQLHMRLLYRRRFSSERRFIDREVHCDRDPTVRRHPISGVECHHITRNHFPRGNASLDPLTDHMGEWCRHLLQRLQRALGAVFLDEAKQHGEQHDDADDNRFESMSEHARDKSGRKEDQDQDVLELRGERMPRRGALENLQFVWPIPGQSTRSLAGGQA